MRKFENKKIKRGEALGGEALGGEALGGEALKIKNEANEELIHFNTTK